MRRLIFLGVLAVVLSVSMAGAARAQVGSFAISGLVGAGGALDESGSGFGNLNWQLGFSNSIEDKTYFGIRLGGLDWGSAAEVDEFTGPSLLYLTLSGEYRETSGSFSGSFIDSGVFLGLGFYRIDGTLADGESASESGPGVGVGLSGDIPLNKKRTLALRIEFSGHYALLDAAQLFALAQIGMSYRF